MNESRQSRRPRPIISCLRCRHKKLKCDRRAPCENCVKALTEKTCTYSRDGHVPTRETTPSTATSTANSIEDLQRRMLIVEQLMGAKQAVSEPLKDTAVPPSILGSINVKGDRGVYHGQNDRITLLNQFPEVKHFLNVMSNDKHIQASVKQIKFLQTKSMAARTSLNYLRDYGICPSAALRDHLPPKPYCDRLVAIYCNHFERSMRVLHIPAFKQQYEQIWTNSDIASTSPSTVPQLTAVMTMAYHMDESSQTGDDGSYESYLQGPAIDLIQGWLDKLSRKQRTELSTLQLEILVSLSRSLRGSDPYQIWSSTGTLVRSAMIMGLNLDPSSITGLVPFHAEMRRRLWATVLEMDLQASMAVAVPAVLPEFTNSPLPSNLNDAEFDESTTILPQSRSLDTSTDNVYQAVLALSLPVRLKALKLAQCPTTSLKEALQVGDEIEQYLNSVPEVVKFPNSPVLDHYVGVRLHQVLLDLYLRRPVLFLYKSLLQGQWQPSPELIEMQRRCLSSSVAILSYQDLFSTASLAQTTNNPMMHQDFFYRCCKKDVLWAATTCCQNIKMLRGAPTDVHSARQFSEDSTSLVSTVEATITCLTRRMGRKGSDLKDIVLLSLVLHSVQFSGSPSRDSHALQQLLRSTLAACCETLLHPMLATDQQTCEASSKTHARPSETNLSAVHAPDMTFSFPNDLVENAQQWFADLPDLAAEFTDFEAQMSGSNDVLSIGFNQEWDWENMWS